MFQLIARAAALPDAVESIACAGIAVEKRSFKARDKASLFLGVKPTIWDAVIKFGPSLDAARALADAEAARYKVGANGWVTAILPHDAPAPGHLGRWLGERYGLVVPKARSRSRQSNHSDGHLSQVTQV